MQSVEPSAAPRPVLVIDFGAQYAQLIARRVRESRVFSEVVAHTVTVEEIKARDPQAIVLSGGPASVYADGAPQLDPALFDLGVPVFGICYGFQAMAQALGGTVARTGTSEYGRTDLNVLGGQLHSGLPGIQPVWMSHGDAVTDAPAGFEVVATSPGAPVAAFEDRSRKLAGVQYHPEVIHTPHGQQVLSRFLHEFAGIGATWTPANIAETLIEAVREQIGDGHAICGLSGGVDSAVAAALVQRAIGDRLTCVFVDHGLLRAGEREQVQRDFVAATGARLVDLQLTAGPHVAAKEWSAQTLYESLPRLGTLDDDLKRFLDTWSGLAPEWHWRRERSENGNTNGPIASRHLVRLWARDQINQLRRQRKTTEAVSLAGRWQLVTPVSGAVVLETKAQYKAAGLTPVDPLTTPAIVPEPETWALMIVGTGALALWQRRQKRRP